jgi:Protein of unknown function (DUF3752)
MPPSVGEKRKREDDEDEEPQSSRSPQARSQPPDSASNRSRTIGPTLPPACLDERPSNGPESEEDGSSDDDDFGPSLPPSGGAASSCGTNIYSKSTTSIGPQAPAQVKRDEWMTMAPTNGDWSSRIDPTRLKNRKFNTGKTAKGPPKASGGDDSMWHETPAEKVARLQREMMGIKDTKKSREPAGQESDKTAESIKKIKEYNEKARGPTLYAAHQKSNPREKEDDPSARAFDREKDIAGGMKINTTQRREMMKKAADFGSRFSSAKYL